MACFRAAIHTRVAQVSVFSGLTFTTCIHCGRSRPFSRRSFRSSFSAQTQCCFAMTIQSSVGDPKTVLGSMHMKHHRCDQVTYMVIAMQSRSRAPQVGWP